MKYNDYKKAATIQDSIEELFSDILEADNVGFPDIKFGTRRVNKYNIDYETKEMTLKKLKIFINKIIEELRKDFEKILEGENMEKESVKLEDILQIHISMSSKDCASIILRNRIDFENLYDALKNNIEFLNNTNNFIINIHNIAYIHVITDENLCI